MDPEFIKPFLVGTCQTLKVQCGIDVTVGKPFAKGQGAEVTSDIAGVIGVTSKAFKGSLAMCFPAAAFLKIMSGMLGQECAAINDDLEDGAGELLNIVFGHAKRELNAKGYGLEMALPSVLRGGPLKVVHITDGPVVVVPFTVGDAGFQIEIALRKL